MAEIPIKKPDRESCTIAALKNQSLAIAQACERPHITVGDGAVRDGGRLRCFWTDVMSARPTDGENT
jgi:hypothetical protein